jgi:hypothetical protein
MPLSPVSRLHLEAMSGDLGILQHARGAVPDPAHGYCTDDVARSLGVDLLQSAEVGWDEVAPSAWRALRFLETAFDAPTGRFRNFRGYGGAWLDGPASEDAHARAMVALAEAALVVSDAPYRRRAISRSLSSHA